MSSLDAPAVSSQSIGELLEARARTHPQTPFVRFVDEEFSYRDLFDRVIALAGGLHDLGVSPGIRVVVVMPNSVETVTSMFATAWLGAVWVPINTEFRWPVLRHALTLADPYLVICSADLQEHITLQLHRDDVPVFVLGQVFPSGNSHPFEDLISNSNPVSRVDIDPHENYALLYTSGTTGRSKACELSHEYFTGNGHALISALNLRKDDVLYCPFPLFHIDASVLTVIPALLLGTTAALGRRFSTSRYWSEVRQMRATVMDFMGATLCILRRAPRSADDTNPIRLAWGVPVPTWAPDFETRFGLTVRELYGSTEAGLPIIQPDGLPRAPGSCGQVVKGAEIRVVDPAGSPLPEGIVGDLQVRYSDGSRRMLNGYFHDPEATNAAFDGDWFRTGDIASIDAEGNVYFVGRSKDVIRRRGENVSAFEVEEALLAHPDVSECAAIGVPSELTEDDVKVVVVPRSGSTLTARELYEFARKTMPRFQVPRYIELATSLPHTPTGKVEKFRLAENWRSAQTVDFDFDLP